MPALADLLALLRMDEKPLLRSVVGQGFATSRTRRSRVDAVVPLSLQPDTYVYVPELPQMLWCAAQEIFGPLTGLEVDDELVSECAEPVNNALGTPRALRYRWELGTPAAMPRVPSFPTRFDVIVVDGVQHGQGWRGEEGNAKLVGGEFKRPEASSPDGLLQRVQRELVARVVAPIDTFAEADSDARDLLLKLAAGATFAKTRWLIWYDAVHYFLGYRLVDQHDPTRYDLLVSRLTSVAGGQDPAAPSVAEALLAIMLEPQIEMAAIEAHQKAGVDGKSRPYKPRSASPERKHPETEDNSPTYHGHEADPASSRRPSTRSTTNIALNLVDRSGQRVLNARLKLVQAYDSTLALVTSSDQTPSIPSFCFEEISSVAAPSTLQLATSPVSSTASSATSSSGAIVQPPAQLTLVFTRVLHGAMRVQVWGAEGYPGYHEVAVKVVRASRMKEVQREIAVLRGPLLGASDLVVPMLAVCATPLPCGPGEREHVAEILEICGESPGEWSELSLETRLSLFVALVRIHQTYRVAHNDIAPRNCVVERSATDGARARWIDWGAVSLEHECAGVKSCRELSRAAKEMGLTRDNWTTTQVALEQAGLRI